MDYDQRCEDHLGDWEYRAAVTGSGEWYEYLRRVRFAGRRPLRTVRTKATSTAANEGRTRSTNTKRTKKPVDRDQGASLSTGNSARTMTAESDRRVGWRPRITQPADCATGYHPVGKYSINPLDHLLSKTRTADSARCQPEWTEKSARNCFAALRFSRPDKVHCLRMAKKSKEKVVVQGHVLRKGV